MNKFSKIITHSYRFVTKDMWRETAQGLGKGKRFGLGTLKTLVMSAKGFNQNNINMRANALTYSMMFAIVPILAMIIAVARGFGFDHVIEETLNASFLQNYHIVPTLMGFVDKYLETAQGGAFLGIGIIILLWAVYSFFRNVETSFNTIWQVEQNRSIVRQFTNYLTILILVPVLVVMSSGISIVFHTQLGDLAITHSGVLHKFFIKLVPWLSTCLVLFLLYWMVPNTKVKFLSALIPGMVFGTIVFGLQELSVYFILMLSRTSIVYGTFAAFPILLMWLQWMCLLILTGAELSYALQNKEEMNFAADTATMSRRYKDYLTLYICQQIVKRFEACGTPLSANEIAQADNLPTRIVNQLLSRLVEAKILNYVGGSNETEDIRYQPAMDINKMSIGLVLAHVDAQGNEGFFPNLPPEMTAFWEKWMAIKQEDEIFNQLLIKDL